MSTEYEVYGHEVQTEEKTFKTAIAVLAKAFSANSNSALKSYAPITPDIQYAARLQ